jgi:hypothetical protein
VLQILGIELICTKNIIVFLNIISKSFKTLLLLATKLLPLCKKMAIAILMNAAPSKKSIDIYQF